MHRLTPRLTPRLVPQPMPRLHARAVVSLARADLSLGRKAAIAYATAAAVGAALIAIPDATARSLGSSLLMSVLIGQSFHLPIVLVFHDLARGTRAFTLSLPVTAAEYAAAKLLASAVLFMIPAVAGAVALAVLPADERLMPPALVALVGLGWLIFFVQNLGLAMVTESMGITVTALLAQVFVVGNGLMMAAPRVTWCRDLWAGLESDGAVRLAASGVLLAELAATVALILVLMDRKRRLL